MLLLDLETDMRLDVFVNFAFAEPGMSQVLARLDSVVSLLNGLTVKVNTMSAELDALSAAVAAEDTVIDSAITLLQGLSAQITALKTDPVALQALADDVTAKAAALAAAVTANTPTP